MVGPADLKEILELALDRVLEEFDMTANFYTDYGLDSMGAVVFFVELQKRTGVEVSLDSAPHLQNGAAITDFLRSTVSPPGLHEEAPSPG